MSSESMKSELVKLDPKSIIPNQENPRLLFDEDELAYLKESIDELGVLVPILVYERSVDKKYVILDGERRWNCAIQLGIKKVPCNIISEPTRIANILRMFNIHNTRKEWDLVPTALKLQTIIKLLGEKSNSELARLTGMSSIRVAECKRVLSFPKKFLEYALISDRENRITGDFFSQLYGFLDELEKIPEVKKEFTKDEITEIMIEKYRKGSLPAILDLRVLTKTLKDAKKLEVNKKTVANITIEYLKPQSKVTQREGSKDVSHSDYEQMTPQEFYSNTVGTSLNVYSLIRNIERLDLSLRELNPRTARRDKLLLSHLKTLRATINQILG